MRFQFNGGNLALLALAFWLISLSLPGLVLYADQRTLPGYEILLMGWLSPLVFNFAWFANVFLLRAIYRLRSGGTPINSAVFAVLLSLDTYRFTQFLLDEGGGSTPVYGYGWGAVLWMMSMSIVVMAVGARQREVANTGQSSGERELLLPVGLILCAIVLGSSSYFAITDRMVANSLETQRLSNVAFKRGKICGAPRSISIDPIRNLSGPVEIVIEKQGGHSNYPFAQIKSLLAWGIPTVRVGNTDYSYESSDQSRVLSSVPAANQPAATLYVSEQNSHKIYAKLVETATSRTVFEQTWEQENPLLSTYYYCPDYHSFPAPEQQPRQMLMQALNLSAASAMAREREPPTHLERVDGLIVQSRGILDELCGSGCADAASENLTSSGRATVGKARNAASTGQQVSSGNNGAATRFHEKFNTNCPSDIGWDGSDYNSRLNTGWPFRVKDKAYYPPYSEGHYATCEGDSVYIYSGTASNGKYFLNIEAHTLPDFRQTWATIIVLSGLPPSTRNNALKVLSVDQAGSDVSMKLADFDVGQVLVVRASLKKPAP